jgi:cobalt-zinc-cadmium efflux system outer membrane protein
MRRRFILLFVLVASPCVGQTTISAERVVFLDTVLELARERAPAIVAARARVTQAEERGRAATIYPDPVLTGGLGRGKPPDGGAAGTEWSLELSQSLPAPWGQSSRKRVRGAAVEAASRQVDAVTLDVLLDAKILYYEAALGASRAAALAQAADDARSLSELVARRVEVGEAPGADHLRTRVEALRAAADARAASAQAEGAEAALNRFLLGSLGSEFALPTDLDPSVMAPLPEGTVELAASRNPVFRAAQSRAEAARSAVAVERAARLPGLEVSAYSQSEIDRKAYGATLGIAIPLWNRNRAGVGIAQAELAEAEAEANALRVGIEADVERLLRRDRAAREIAAWYRADILPAARETLAIVRNSLEQGEANLLNWLEARRSLLETLKVSYDAQLEAFLTRAELVRLTGESNAIDK